MKGVPLACPQGFSAGAAHKTSIVREVGQDAVRQWVLQTLSDTEVRLPTEVSEFLQGLFQCEIMYHTPQPGKE